MESKASSVETESGRGVCVFSDWDWHWDWAEDSPDIIVKIIARASLENSPRSKSSFLHCACQLALG